MTFYVKIKANGNDVGDMSVYGDMLFSELAFYFCRNFGLQPNNKPTFSFNSKEIKAESPKKLSELGITANSVIEVKTENPIGMPNNAGNVGAFQNPMMMNQPFMNQQFMNQQFMNQQFMNQQFMNQQFMNQQNMNQQFMNQQNMNQQFINQQNMNNFVNQNQTQNPNPNNGQNANKVQSPGGNSDFLNIIFNAQGKKVMVQGQGSTVFSEISQKFSNKAGTLDKVPTFIYNSKKIESTDKRTLNELEIKDNGVIEVFYNSEVIGA